jgi:hypothetical protein
MGRLAGSRRATCKTPPRSSPRGTPRIIQSECDTCTAPHFSSHAQWVAAARWGVYTEGRWAGSGPQCEAAGTHCTVWNGATVAPQATESWLQQAPWLHRHAAVTSEPGLGWTEALWCSSSASTSWQQAWLAGPRQQKLAKTGGAGWLTAPGG